MAAIKVQKDFPASNEDEFAQKRDNFLEKAPQYIIDAILPKEETEAFMAVLIEDKARFDKKNEDKIISHNSTHLYQKGHKTTNKATRAYKKLSDNNPLVTPEISHNLGLFKEECIVTTNNKRPDLKIKENGGNIVITFTKFPMDGIILFSKTNDGTYDFQTIVKGSKFIDTRPRINPKILEVREYYAYYIYNDQKVGQQSEIIRIILNPIE